MAFQQFSLVVVPGSRNVSDEGGRFFLKKKGRVSDEGGRGASQGSQEGTGGGETRASQPAGRKEGTRKS